MNRTYPSRGYQAGPGHEPGCADRTTIFCPKPTPQGSKVA